MLPDLNSKVNLNKSSHTVLSFTFKVGGHHGFLQGIENETVLVGIASSRQLLRCLCCGDVLCNHVKQVVVAAGEGAVAGMSL
jgi:thioredoxin reductase